MLNVLRSYIPFFIWLVLAAFALAPLLATADTETLTRERLQQAHALFDAGRWNEAARLGVPPSPTATRAQSGLIYVRGLAAAKAGYAGMAWHSVERLEALRDRFLAAGETELSREANDRAGEIASAIPPGTR